MAATRTASRAGFTKCLVSLRWLLVAGSLTLCLFPRSCLTGGSSGDRDIPSDFACGPNALNACPKSLGYTGLTNDQGQCTCQPGFRLAIFGCEHEAIQPQLELDRMGSHSGEVGAKVTFRCIPFNDGIYTFRWFLNGTHIYDETSSTYVHVLIAGTQRIRCAYQVGYWDTNLASPEIEMTGYNSIGDLDFSTNVVGIPEVAIKKTKVDLTCANIPWTKEPLPCFWEVEDDPKVKGVGLYELKGFRITRKRLGSYVRCYVKPGLRKSVPKPRLPRSYEKKLPDIVIEGGNRLALTGQSVQLKCRLKGQSYPETSRDIKWTWRLNNEEQEEFTTPDIVLTSVSKGRHEGAWKCVARYRKTSFESGLVNVFITDESPSATLTITPEMPISKTYLAIRCHTNVTVDVPITYAWTWSFWSRGPYALPAPTGSTLFVPQVLPTLFTCTVNAGGLTVTSDELDLTNAVSFTESPAPVLEFVGGASGSSLNYGETLDITCNVPSNWTVHCMQYEFFQDGVSVSKGGAPEYTITNDVITGESTREYTCRAAYFHFNSEISNALEVTLKGPTGAK